MDKYDLFILGAGAAGLTAALSAKEAGAEKVLLVDRTARAGGILPRCLHQGFGLQTYGEELTGPEYAERILAEVRRTDIEIRLNTAVFSVSPNRRAVLSGREGLCEIAFDRMISAAGCREKNIGSLPIAGTRPAGVFTAGQAQEMINLKGLELGQKIVVLGSGDLGLIMARQFTLQGKHVLAVVEKEKKYGGMARNYHRCIEPYAIPLICSAEITRIFGEERINAVLLHRLDSDTYEKLSCDTLVTALGLTPERSLTDCLGNPDWLALCGNCSRVHDIVDSAVDEARRVGKNFGGKT